MKKFISFITIASLLASLVACGSASSETKGASASSAVNASVENSAEQDISGTSESTVADENAVQTESTENDGRILVAYFSRADENYGVGVIEKGNTEIIAEMIAEETDGDLFHIERETAYPAEYDACTDEAKQEKGSDARPALAEGFSPDEYDVIYLGYPIWWGDMPMPVYTWLESHDFDGKTIIPFCTHAGSGLSGTEENIQTSCPGASVLDGFEISGATAQNEQETAQNAVCEWLSRIAY